MADVENYIQARGHTVVGKERATGRAVTLPVVMWAVTVFDDPHDYLGEERTDAIAFDAVGAYEGELRHQMNLVELTVSGVYADADVPEALARLTST